MKLDINELKKITEEAAAKNKKDAEEAAIRLAEYQKQFRLKQDAEDQERAQKFISLIADKAKYAAQRAENSAFIYEISRFDCYDVHDSLPTEKYKLTRAAKIVFDYCEENGLNPTVGICRTKVGDTYEEGYGYIDYHDYGIKICW